MTEVRNFADAPIDNLVKKFLPDFILQLLKAYGYVNLGDLTEFSEDEVEALEGFVTSGLLSSRVDLNDPTVRTKYLGNAKPSTFTFMPIEKRKLIKLKSEAELEMIRLKALHNESLKRRLEKYEEIPEIICRLCLKKNVEVAPLFRASSAFSLLAVDLVKEIIPEITIEMNDGFSQNVCLSCLNVLKSACSLRALSIENDKSLKHSQTLTSCEVIKVESEGSNNPLKITNCVSLNEETPTQMDPLEICLERFASRKRKRPDQPLKLPAKTIPKTPATPAANESKDLVEIYFQDVTTDKSKPFFRCLLCQKKLRGDYAIYRKHILSNHKDSADSLGMDSKKKKFIPLDLKVRIIELLESGKANNTTVSKLYGISASNISKIWKKRKIILECGKQFEGNVSTRYKTHLSKFRMTEDSLFMWMVQERSKNVVITNQEFRNKALELHGMLKMSCGDVFGPFEASPGWLTRFKNRYGLKCLLSTETELKVLKKKYERLVKQKGLQSNQQYNVDESAIFYKMLPKYKDQEDEEKDRKSQRERFTVMACTNKTGDNKLELLVIGKSQGIDDSEENSPVHYNQSGCLTRDLFHDWFHQNFVPAVREFSHKKGILPKAVLILDNCSAHNTISNLASKDGKISAYFLPPNVSSMSQPMENGIFSALKLRYRKKLLQHVTDQESLNDLNCRNLLVESWNEISEATIQKSWNELSPIDKALEVQDDEMEDNELEIDDEDICEKEEAEEIHEEIQDQDIVKIALKLHEKSSEETEPVSLIEDLSADEASSSHSEEPDEFFN